MCIDIMEKEATSLMTVVPGMPAKVHPPRPIIFYQGIF
jgi:hypothetical protein